MFRLPDFCLDQLDLHQRVSVSHVCPSVNRVSESHFTRLLAGFRKPDMTVKIISASPAAYGKGFHTHQWLTETREKLYVAGFSKDLQNSVFIEADLKCIFKYLKNY
jgi:hypothetical protein